MKKFSEFLQENSFYPKETKIVADLDGFEKTLSHLMAGKAIKALTTVPITSRGKYYTSIKELIKFKISHGATIEISGSGQKRLMNPDGSFSDQKSLTKIGMDYAEYLLKHKK